MSSSQILTRELSPGFKARKLRVSLCLSQRGLADLAGVSREYVDLFERNLPLPLDIKRKILKSLWAKKVEK